MTDAQRKWMNAYQEVDAKLAAAERRVAKLEEACNRVVVMLDRWKAGGKEFCGDSDIVEILRAALRDEGAGDERR